jgi:hypothetical protein
MDEVLRVSSILFLGLLINSEQGIQALNQRAILSPFDTTIGFNEFRGEIVSNLGGIFIGATFEAENLEGLGAEKGGANFF